MDGEKEHIDVLHAILEGMGKGADDFDWSKTVPGTIAATPSNSSKLRSELGWEPKHTDFAEGLKATIAWYRATPRVVAGRQGGRRGQYAKQGQ